MDNNAADADLVAETLSGNRESFGQLYDRHARMVRAVVAGVSGDWPAVEDMTQDCFLRAYRNLARLRDPHRFGPWVVGIARQVGRERLRSLRRDRHEFRDPQPWEIESPLHSHEVISDRDQIELAMRVLDGLPERERVAVHAFYVHQQNAQEAAEQLGLSRSGFYALLQRALARLAAQIESCEPNLRRSVKWRA
jgi:RNA polymerase sigma factor (sigma-70 family)